MNHLEQQEDLAWRKQEQWENQSLAMNQIYQNGIGSLFAKSSPEVLAKMFAGKKPMVCCMDEGEAEAGDVRSAGPMCLLDEGEAEKNIKEHGLTGLYSHDGCGAAGLYAKNNSLPADQADEIVREKTEKLAQRLGLEHRHIAKTEMKRPVDFHNARMIYVDGTGKFQFTESKDLPRSFVVSPAYFPMPTAMNDLAIALSIAFGSHGLGDKFTAAEPLVITVIGHPKKQALSIESLVAQVFEIAKPYGDRVKIETYQPPAEFF